MPAIDKVFDLMGNDLVEYLLKTMVQKIKKVLTMKNG